MPSDAPGPSQQPSGVGESSVSKKKKIDHLPNSAYRASGVKSTLHGVVYQLKLLMLFAWRGKERGYAFRLATEMDDAEKFDDVVFQYMKTDTGRVYSRFLQAKHIQIDNEKKEKISKQDLLTVTDDKFSLQKYFTSYMKIKKNPKFSSELQDFVMCTNIDFDFDLSKDPNLKTFSVGKSLHFEKISEEDDILNIGGERYRFVRQMDKEKRNEVVTELKKSFEKTTDFKKLADALAWHLMNKKTIGLDNVFFKSYQMPLAQYVIDIKKEKLSKDFLDEKYSHVESFRNEFRNAVESLQNPKIKSKTEPPGKKAKPNEFWEEMSKLPLNLSEKFKEILVLNSYPELIDLEEFTKEMVNLINKRTKITIQQGEKRGNVTLNSSEMAKLAGHVLVKHKINEEVVLSESFLNGGPLAGKLGDFRTKLMENLHVHNYKDFHAKLSIYTFKITAFQTCKESELDNLLQSTFALPNSEILEAEVNMFLDKLVFAVNQPNEEKLSQLISDELLDEFNLIDAELVTDNFQENILNWMKEKQGENRYLSENDIHAFLIKIREKVAQLVLIGPTSEYTKKIDEIGIEFKSESIPSELRTFLNPVSLPCGSDINTFNLVTPVGETFLGTIKVRQQLNEFEQYDKDGSYIFICLSSLLRLKKRVIEAFQQESTNLLIVECKYQESSVNNQLHDVLLNISTSREKKKVLVISSNKNIEEKSNFNDLTEISQNKLLEANVKFQGVEISLNKLVDEMKSPLSESLPLVDLLRGKLIEIGKPVTISYGYDLDFYIDRTFNQQAIKQDIFNDYKLNKFTDMLAKSEQEFDTLCQENPEESIHWLEETNGQWLWKKSQGSLMFLRMYIDSNHIQHYTQEDMQQAQQGRIMIIADTAGMGKTTVLTHLAKQINEQHPSQWVVKIDLNDYTGALKQVTSDQIVDPEVAVKFVVDNLLMLKEDLEKSLFKHLLDENKLLLIFDGFDEISPDYKNIVILLLKALIESKAVQIWVTTRPHLKVALEDSLKQFSYTLEPFSEANQVDFLCRLWKKKFGTNLDEPRLKFFAQTLVETLATSVLDKEKKFTGIPLQTRMIAEIFERRLDTSEIPEKIKNEIETIEEGAEEFCLSEAEKPIFPNKMRLLNLYNIFVYKKYFEVYGREKSKSETVAANDTLIENYPLFIEKHQKLSLYALLGMERCKNLLDEDEDFEEAIHLLINDIQVGKEKRGIIDQIIEGKPHFIHRTFTEYFVADFLAKYLRKQTVEAFLLKEVLLQDDYHVIRSFLNGQIAKIKIPETIKKKYGTRIGNLWQNQPIALRYLDKNDKSDGTLLHRASTEDNTNVINFLFESVNQVDPNILKELLVATNNKKQTAFHLAAEAGHTEVLEKLWEYGNNHMNLLKELFMAKDNTKRTAFHLAATAGQTEVLEKLWDYAKTKIKLIPQDLKEFLLASDNRKKNAFHWTAANGKMKSLEKLRELGELAENNGGETTLHLAAKAGHTSIIDQLWEWVKSKATLEPEKLEKFWLVKDKEGKTAWHLASETGRTVVINQLWEFVKYTATSTIAVKYKTASFNEKDEKVEELIQKQEELKKFWLVKDNNGQSAFHLAALRGQLEVLEKLWGMAETDMNLKTENLSELWHDKDNDSQTAWNLAALQSQTEVIEKLWDWAKVKMPGELRDIWLAEDVSGKNAFQMTASCKNLKSYNILIKTLDKLWLLGKQVGLTPKNMLLEKDKGGKTAWHLAVCGGVALLLQKLWDWAKNEAELTPEDLKAFLLDKMMHDQISFHRVAVFGYVKALVKLWDLGIEIELKPKEMLLAINQRRQNPFHLAVAKGKIRFLDTLYELGLSAKLTPEQMLLAKDNREQTVFHLALSQHQILEKLREFGKSGNLTTEQMLYKNQDKRTTTVEKYAERMDVDEVRPRQDVARSGEDEVGTCPIQLFEEPKAVDAAENKEEEKDSGKLPTPLDIAKNLLAANVSLDVIKNCTKLTDEEWALLLGS